MLDILMIALIHKPNTVEVGRQGAIGAFAVLRTRLIASMAKAWFTRGMSSVWLSKTPSAACSLQQPIISRAGGGGVRK